MADLFLERRSALAGHYRSGRFGQPGAAGVHLGERRGLATLQLVGPARDSAFVGEIWKILGLDLPLKPNRWNAKEGRVACWSAPDRWTLQLPEGELEALRPRLAAALAEGGGALFDLSQARTILAVAGPRAAELLGKGCPLDLHPKAFRPGHSAQTILAGIAVLLRREKAEAFELQVTRSYALHLWEWLRGAAAEYGYRVGEAAAGRGERPAAEA